MRNNRFVVALVAVACAAALPAAAAAHKGQPSKGHHGKGDNITVRLSPAANQTAKGAVELKQRAGALSVELRVSGLTPGAFYATDLHKGSCLAQDPAVQVAFPDIYANERGVAKLVTTVRTAAGASFVAGGYYVDVHTSTTGTPVIACGDIAPRVVKSSAKSFLKGAAGERGRAELLQKGSDVAVWLKLKGLTPPGGHAVQIWSGTCAAPTASVISLADVAVAPDGTVFAKAVGTSSIPVVAKGYSLHVYTGPSSGIGALELCGDLWPTWKHGYGHK